MSSPDMIWEAVDSAVSVLEKELNSYVSSERSKFVMVVSMIIWKVKSKIANVTKVFNI